MSSSSKKISRRVLTATAGGFAVGAFAARFGGAVAHEGHDDATPGADASPAAVTPLGQVIMRVRYLVDESAAAEVNDRVLAEFVPALEALEGFAGYLVGDLVDQPAVDLTVTVLKSADDVDIYDQQVVQPFVSSLGDLFDASRGEGWNGDLLITGAPTGDDASPAPGWPLRSGYVAARVHTSLPGTNPRDFVPLAISGFLPIVEGLDGFEGYLWFPIDGGFVAISLFDSEASALASNDAARAWAAEFLTDYTDGNPAIYNANIVYANFPVLGA